MPSRTASAHRFDSGLLSNAQKVSSVLAMLECIEPFEPFERREARRAHPTAEAFSTSCFKIATTSSSVT